MKMLSPPLLVALLLASSTAPAQPRAAGKPTPQEAKAFVAQVNADLKSLWTRQQTAEWVKATHITDDTEQLAAWANEDVLAYLSRAIKDSMRFQGLTGLDPDTARMLYLLRIAWPLPPPTDPKKRTELSEIASKLEGIYGKGKWCGPEPKPGVEVKKRPCRDLQALEELMAKSRNYDELLDAWVGWRTVSPPMRPLYERLISLANDGARDIGFKDVGELWRAGYDMSPAEFEKDSERLWNELKPLYEQLHCYVRGRLQKTYGKNRVPDGKPIPAHLLGNMWAQEWANIYKLVEPYPGAVNLDVDAALKRQKYTPLKMVQTGERFFTSLGLEPLPKTFWDRSMFVKPEGREAVCHASAWDLTYAGDIRIKMCIRPLEEDLVTIHHELGHNYYYVYYHDLPVLYQQGANDGFHEAIGDAIALSITPAYLKEIGLVGAVAKNDKALINVQMKDALDKIAFLPFGKLIDQWRWDVFSGKIAPADYNKTWWALRTKYQGVAAPVERTEADFDPGAKYHIPANVPYTRYFLARIYQFQFHRALCQAAGFKGPLHECSIYGNKDAGARLKALLELGASKPWPEAMQAMTGQKAADASALLEYFQPLRAWLAEQNKGQQCGW